MSLNRATLIGHVGKDPEVKHIDSGVKVASFSLATTERGYTLTNGTQVPERTEWHNIVAWKGLAEIIEKYVKKGSQLYIEGKIQTRSWEKDGIKKYMTEIVAENIQMLGAKDQTRKPTTTTQAPETRPTATPEAQAKQDETDDLPF